MSVELEPNTVAIVEIGRESDGDYVSLLFEFANLVPIPRRLISASLRGLADQIDRTASELENLEHTT